MNYIFIISVIVDTLYLPNNSWVEFSTVKVTAVEGGRQATFTKNSQAGSHCLFICSQQPDYKVVLVFYAVICIHTMRHQQVHQYSDSGDDEGSAL